MQRSGVRQGLLVAVGQHTSTALVLNENEERLLRDIKAFFLGLAPPERPWLHNDLHLRQGIPADEPRNAHAHLIAMVLGNQLSLPVVEGRLGIGRWQSVLLVSSMDRAGGRCYCSSSTQAAHPRQRDATRRWEQRLEIGVGASDLGASEPRGPGSASLPRWPLGGCRRDTGSRPGSVTPRAARPMAEPSLSAPGNPMEHPAAPTYPTHQRSRSPF